MKFNDEGIIIDVRKYGEKSLILKVFSRHHGIYSGFVKYAKSSKAAAIYHVGNLVSFEFHSRLEDNLGSFAAVDLVRSYYSQIIFERTKLNCLNSLFSLLNKFFLEREKQENIFTKLHCFLEEIIRDETAEKKLIANYIKLELDILESLGYGIDLSCCVVNGSTVNLAFVSPKSARAVSLIAGKAYEKQLLPLPSFLIQEEENFNNHHLLDGLKLSGYFIEKFLFDDKKLTHSLHREQLLKALEK